MYDVGDVVPLGITVTNADGVPSDATSVTLTIGLPDGTTVTPTVVHVASSGVYTVDYPTAMEGLHTVRWVATGTNATSYQDVFNVREITEQLIGLAQAKRQLSVTLPEYDDEVRMFIAAAGRAVEDHLCKTLVRRTFTEKHYRVCGRLILNHVPVISIVSVASTDGATTWDPDDLDVDTDTGIVRSLSGAALWGDLNVTLVAGMRSVPPNYLLAVRIITEHLWQTMRGQTQPDTSAGGYGDSLDARAGGLVGFAIPNRALELLGKPPPLVA
jgi:uncharacterized phiE125 gp8 family phage protein